MLLLCEAIQCFFQDFDSRVEKEKMLVIMETIETFEPVIKFDGLVDTGITTI